MTRYQLLAAEIFGYSYDNYDDHLGVNMRYDRSMPETVKRLENAETEKWPLQRLAKALKVDTDEAAALMDAFRSARLVVDAANPAESFRAAIRHLVRTAAQEGLNDDKAIDNLVVQICYRAADLSFLLKRDGKPLSDYSQALRRENDVESHEGEADEEE